RELNVQLALGGSLSAARGYAHAETEATYERAVALAEAIGHSAQLGTARVMLATVYNSRGEVERGRARFAELLAMAEARGDQEQALLGHWNLAVPEYFQGKFASSLAHCERAIELYDPVQHRGLIRVVVNDPAATAMTWAAQNLWFLGRPDAALT